MADTYQQVFSGEPWNEDGMWPKSRVEEIFNLSKNQKGFKSKLLVDNSKDVVVGFTWGYDIPKEQVADINFEKIYSSLPDFYKDGFWMCDTGVRKEFQGKGLAQVLFSEMLNLGVDKVVSRTINPALIRARNIVYGECKNLGNDPVYNDRKIYGWFKK